MEERGEKNWIKVREFEDGRDVDCIRKGEKLDMDNIDLYNF